MYKLAVKERLDKKFKRLPFSISTTMIISIKLIDRVSMPACTLDSLLPRTLE